ncbi:MAG: hypothetical protein EPO24_05205 [Bacteroidetes bacterium]|nr:MAG: hypothetical protein EPO24_05205 [Bacteroidota bacterium]
MNDKFFTLTFIVCLLLLGLQCIGIFFPSAYNWGFHFAGFLPGYIAAIYLLLGTIALLTIAYGKQETVLNAVGSLAEKKPVFFLLGIITFFLALAFTFKIQVPLLGDSYVITNIIENAVNGRQALRLHSEPLSIFFFYSISVLTGAAQTAEIQNAFFFAELLLGVGYCINIFVIAKTLFSDGKKQALLTGFLMTLPSLQLFLGYIEWYPFVFFCLSLYLLTIVLYIKRNTPFYFLLPAYFLVVGSHYVNGLFLPALLFLAYHEIKTNGYKHLLIGTGILCLLGFVLLWMMDFDAMKLFQREEPVPLLALFSTDDRYNVYTLFSVYHAIDILNLVIMLGSFTALFFFVSFVKKRNTILRSLEGWYFVFLQKRRRRTMP